MMRSTGHKPAEAIRETCREQSSHDNTFVQTQIRPSRHDLTMQGRFLAPVSRTWQKSCDFTRLGGLASALTLRE